MSLKSDQLEILFSVFSFLKSYTQAYELYTFIVLNLVLKPKIVSEYDQEIPQSQTADNPMAPRGRAAQPS